MSEHILPEMNGSSPAAITIHVVPHPQGQQITINHRLTEGWQAVQQLLLAALHIAVAKQIQEQQQPPLIAPVQLDPRLRRHRN